LQHFFRKSQKSDQVRARYSRSLRQGSTAVLSFVAQCFDRVERRGFGGRETAENDADADRNEEGDQN